jgi:bifunctional enzyme CysN/CysC
VGDRSSFRPITRRASWRASSDGKRRPSDQASAGESIGITLTEQIFVERGHVASHAAHAPIESNRFRARLFWMGRRNLEPGQRYKLKLATQELDAEVVSIDRIIDASTLETMTGGRTHIARNDVAEVVIQTRGALVMDNHDQNPILGRFVIVDDRHVSGGGIIFGGVYTDRGRIKSANIFWTKGMSRRGIARCATGIAARWCGSPA